MKKLNKKHGFTLAELLIVVAIIAVLVAISIPIFTTQLEKSREAVDMANIRAAYAEVVSDALTDDQNDHSKKVELKQTDKTKWTTDNNTEIAGVKLSAITLTSGEVEVKYTKADGKVTIAGTVTTPGGEGEGT